MTELIERWTYRLERVADGRGRVHCNARVRKLDHGEYSPSSRTYPTKGHALRAAFREAKARGWVERNPMAAPHEVS